MSKKKDVALIVAGILVGAALVGPAAHAVSDYIQAQQSPCAVYVDGKQVELDAYLIHENNYVQLRDIGKAVGFNVYWDGSVQIETGRPYTGEPPAQETVQSSEVDYSQQANSAVFTGYLTKDVYNTVRKAILTGETTSFGSAVVGFTDLKYDSDEALRKRAEEETNQISFTLTKLGQYPDYRLSSGSKFGEKGYVCEVYRVGYGSDILEHTKGFLDSLDGLSEREKIKRIDWYVCDRIAYDATCYAWPKEVLTQDGIVRGACMSYAYSFQFLCQQVGIPCILVSSDIHQWNMVYAEGRWWEVDVTGDDCDGVNFISVGTHGEAPMESHIDFDGTDAFREEYYVTSDRVLWDRTTKPYLNSDFTNSQPEATLFAQELLVPGSTK